MSSRKCKGCDAFFSIRLDACPTCGTVYLAKQAVPRVFHHCAGPSCASEGLWEVQTGNGYEWLCERHYETQNQEEAKAYSEKHNLKTPADHLAHITALMRKPKQFSIRAHWERVRRESKSALAQQYADQVLRRYPTREPGEDDE